MQGRFPPQQEQYTFIRLYYDVDCLFHLVLLHYTNIDYTTLHSLHYNTLQQTTLLFTAHTTLHCTTLLYTNIYLLVTDPPHTNSSIDNGTHSQVTTWSTCCWTQERPAYRRLLNFLKSVCPSVHLGQGQLGSWNFEKMFTSHNVSHVRCQVSGVMCHVSGVIFFWRGRGQRGGASQWRVCYRRGPTCLVLCTHSLNIFFRKYFGN